MHTCCCLTSFLNTGQCSPSLLLEAVFSTSAWREELLNLSLKFLELQFQFACLLLPFFLSLREDAHHLMSPGSAFSSAARTTYCCSNPTVSERVATKTDPYPTVTLSFMSQTEARLTQPLSLPHAIVVAIVAACCNVDLVNDRQMPTSTAGSQQHSEGGVKSLWSVTPGPPVMLQHLLQ